MDENLQRNLVELRGEAEGEPVFSHENHGERFYRFPLAVARLSGQTDRLNVLLTEFQFLELLPLTGRQLFIAGQLRSFNNKSGQGSRLIITVLARQLRQEAGEPRNIIHLSGAICKPPILRRTPLGRCISDMMLAVNRRYGRADYLPCIGWGQVAVTVGHMAVGTPLALEGRVQSRVYTKVLEDRGAEERTAFEVSIMQLEQDPPDREPGLHIL